MHSSGTKPIIGLQPDPRACASWVWLRQTNPFPPCLVVYIEHAHVVGVACEREGVAFANWQGHPKISWDSRKVPSSAASGSLQLVCELRISLGDCLLAALQATISATGLLVNKATLRWFLALLYLQERFLTDLNQPWRRELFSGSR